MQKRNTIGKKERQRGAILLLLVFAMFVLGVLLLAPMLIQSGTLLRDNVQGIAWYTANTQSYAQSSYIRQDMANTINTSIESALQAHLTTDRQYRAYVTLNQGGSGNMGHSLKPPPSQSGGSGTTTYWCQGAVDTQSMTLSQTWGLCDPTAVLPANMGGKTNQVYDGFSKIRSLMNIQNTGNGVTPEGVRIEPALDAVKYELTGNYDYTLSSAFLGEQVLRGVTNTGSGWSPRIAGPKGRIERYRWLVRADMTTRSWDYMEMPYTVYFDVVTTVEAFDSNIGCTTQPRTFSVNQPGISAIAVCLNPGPQADPNTSACTDIAFYMADDTPGSYQDNCHTNPKDPTDDTCQDYANQHCTSENTAAGLCAIPNVGAYQNISSPTTFSASGCASIPPTRSGPLVVGAVGTTNTGSYTWTTVIRLVSAGPNFDARPTH